MQKKTITAREVTQLFEKRLFSQYGVPRMIVSDRDPKFTSAYWKDLTDLMGIRLNMSTADHRQTDGQSENMIRSLSQMLKSFIQRNPKEWDSVLPQMEFEYNASKNASTGHPPFEVDTGRIAKTPFSRSLEDCNVRGKEAVEDSDRRQAYQTLARENILLAQQKQKYYADKHRRDVSFEVGDLVLLNIEGLDVTTRADLPDKWCAKFLRPLSVLEVLGPVTYRVELPDSMRRSHNVFHVSKLKKYERADEDGSMNVVIDAKGTTEQVVTAILDKKKENRKVYYLVQFDRQAEADAIWMHKSELTNCRELIAEYNKKNK